MNRTVVRASAGIATFAGAVTLLAPPLGADTEPEGSQPIETDRVPTEAEIRAYPPDDPTTVNDPLTIGLADGEYPATRSLSQCPAGWGCAWTGTSFSGARGQWQGNNATWVVFSQPSCTYSGTSGDNWKNCASSFANKSTTRSVTINRDVNYGGGGVIFFTGHSQTNLASNWINNDVESNHW